MVYPGAFDGLMIFRFFRFQVSGFQVSVISSSARTINLRLILSKKEKMRRQIHSMNDH